jgi:hypothetical protein
MQHGIMYRDLSSAAATSGRGLVDFDLAIYNHGQQRLGAPERTGTPAYMAQHVLDPSVVSKHYI